LKQFVPSERRKNLYDTRFSLYDSKENWIFIKNEKFRVRKNIIAAAFNRRIFRIQRIYTMKKIILAPLLILLFAVVLFAQTTSPTPPPADDDEVVKISTNLIQLDVTVTDSKGSPVIGLKPEDFEVYENGKKQKITNFSFISGVRQKSETVTDPNDKAPVPPTSLKPDQVRRTVALVVDDLSLSFTSTYYVRRALKKFVDEQMQQGDLVAIIRTGAGIGALQQFTTDKRQLYAAIEKVAWNPLGRGGISAFAPINDTRLPGEEAIETENEEEEERGLEDFEGAFFATGTLGALRYIVGGMDELPGRKSVILFSDGFRLLEGRSDRNIGEGGLVMDFMRKLIDAANRSSVVFYTIDARGLVTTGITAEDNIGNVTPGRLQQAITNRSNELFETQSGLSFLAEETGGLAVRNSNDISGGVRRVLDDQSYYLVGYEPDSETFDSRASRFNKLEIRVKGRDLNVRYRSGFFNVADRNVAATKTNQTPAQQIQNALISPFAVNDISLRLNALFGNDAQGSFMRPLLHINAQDLKFTDEPDGVKKAVFDVLAVFFGDNGQPVEQVSNTYTLKVKGEMYERIMKNGFVYYFTLPVKKPGAYQFRVAIRDSQAGKVGSASQFIEVPNLKKTRLTTSGLILENMTEAQWKAFSEETPTLSSSRQTNEAPDKPNPMNDTSLRRFKRGTILRYGFEAYNVKLDASRKPNLNVQVRIFRDGKLILDGKKTPIDVTGQTDMERIKYAGALSLTQTMQPGEYILQIIVTDNLAKEKRRLSTQYVQFEVIN
jgi:VWFA-related protein